MNREPSGMDRISYRRFLRGLPEAIARDLPAGSREARLARGAERTRALLAGLAAPAVPLPVRHGSFLERIYADAAEAGEAAVGPLLRAGLKPATAPTEGSDVALLGPDVGEQMRALLPAPRAPAWLWTRIRADLRASRPSGAQRRARSRAAAAAALFLVGLGAWLFASIRTDGGTSDRSNIVFRQTSQLASLNAFDGGAEQ